MRILLFVILAFCCLACNQVRNEPANLPLHAEGHWIMRELYSENQHTFSYHIEKTFENQEHPYGNNISYIKAKHQFKLFNALKLEEIAAWRKIDQVWFEDEDTKEKIDKILAINITPAIIEDFCLDTIYNEVRRFEKRYKKEGIELLKLVETTFQEAWEEDLQNQINSGFQHFEEFYLIDPKLDKEAWLKSFLVDHSFAAVRAHFRTLVDKYRHNKVFIMRILSAAITANRYPPKNYTKDEIAISVLPYAETKDSLELELWLFRRIQPLEGNYGRMGGEKFRFNKQGLLIIEQRSSGESNKYKEIKGSYQLPYVNGKHRSWYASIYY
ncbi:MAG: hypothetical protein MK212_11865 [Saprospiraceae bacterium]|nr:hypothetical protein [Saprospiraceae bacterium]